MNPLFDTPALRALRAIYANKGPLNMRRFTEATGSAPPIAIRHREALRKLGLIMVMERLSKEHAPEGKPLTRDMGIDLTPRGRKLVELHLAMADVLNRPDV